MAGRRGSSSKSGRGSSGGGRSQPTRRFVSRDPAGGYRVDAPNASRASAKAPTKREAERRAKDIVRNLGGGEVTFRDDRGRIVDSDTVAPGRDPNPPKDTKH
jgi:Uncharacterized protein conserved in bacteria (DUF2188)